MNIDNHRKKASEQSLGKSNNLILDNILTHFNELNIPKDARIIDIGCGQGELLSKVQALGYSNLTGCDYIDYGNNSNYAFFQQDCNQSFPETIENFDVILCSEVIEHIENPWAFTRNLKNIANSNCKLLLSTPNPESLLSIATLFFRGYYNAFGPRDYPAHITAVSTYELKNMLAQIGINDMTFHFMNNGRIPKSNLLWKSIFPFLRGKRFSDNYLVETSFS